MSLNELKVIGLNNYINADDVLFYVISLLDNKPFANLSISLGDLGIKI